MIHNPDNMATNTNNNEILLSLPRQLLAEWKFLIETRESVEQQPIDPVTALRQAIATETYLWQQKASAKQSFFQKIGRIAGN
jgi:hypothetical protein